MLLLSDVLLGVLVILLVLDVGVLNSVLVRVALGGCGGDSPSCCADGGRPNNSAENNRWRSIAIHWSTSVSGLLLLVVEAALALLVCCSCGMVLVVLPVWLFLLSEQYREICKALKLEAKSITLRYFGPGRFATVDSLRYWSDTTLECTGSFSKDRGSSVQ